MDAEDRGPTYSSLPVDVDGGDVQQPLEMITNHFQGMDVNGNNIPIANCSDCVICGKTTMQIQMEAVTGYLCKTAVLGETVVQMEARKRAFIEGMQVGTFLLLLGGVSQAVAGMAIFIR